MKSLTNILIYSTLTLTALILFSVSESHFQLQNLIVAQKATLLVLAIASLLAFKISKRDSAPLLFFVSTTSIALLISIASGESPDTLLFFTSLTSMSTGLIFYSSNLPRKLISRIANVIIALPIISVFASIALFPISGKAPWSIEYTGAYRLTGYLPPAHLAMLCVAAIMICSFKMSEGTQKMGYLTLGTLLLILLATGTRGALIAGITAAIPQIKIPRTLNSLLITFILTIPIGLVGGKALDNILSRNTQQTDYEQINLSGRSTAWAFFLEKSGDAFYFGKGLGAVTKVTKDETQHNLHFFVTPHNEYLRFLYDIGLVGLLLLITGSVIFYLKIKNKLPENEKNAFLAIALSFAIYSGIDNTFGTPQFLIPFFLILKYARTKRHSYCEQQA